MLSHPHHTHNVIYFFFQVEVVVVIVAVAVVNGSQIQCYVSSVILCLQKYTVNQNLELHIIVLILCPFCIPYLRYRYNKMAELRIRSCFNFIHKISILLRPLCGLTKLGNSTLSFFCFQTKIFLCVKSIEIVLVSLNLSILVPEIGVFYS